MMNSSTPTNASNIVSEYGQSHPKPKCDITLGLSKHSPQYGLLGESAGRKIALDLNHPKTIISTGIQGSGKSYTCGSIIEMSLQKFMNINALNHKMAGVIFHYSEAQSYQPEACSMIHPNDNRNETDQLCDKYSATPDQLRDVAMIVPQDKVEERQLEYPNTKIIPLQFTLNQLHLGHLKILMGAEGNPSAYLRVISNIIKGYRQGLTMDILREKVETAGLTKPIARYAMMRLDFLEQFIGEKSEITSILKPGRLVIVDIRDELMEKHEALAIFMVLLSLFADMQDQHKTFNKVVMFDECHKYINHPSLVDKLTEYVREMRHKGTSIILASQDPQSIHETLIELASIILMHKFNSPKWLKHLQKVNGSLKNVTTDKLNTLSPEEAYIWAAKSTDISFTRQAQKIQCRPRITKHGGETLTADRAIFINH